MIRALLAAMVLGAAPVAAVELAPFHATYEVYLDGKPQGRSTMALVHEARGRWRHSIEAEGTRGLARLSGYGLRQHSRFRVVDGRPRLDSADVHSEVVLRSRDIRTVFDWDAGVARWEGDVKADQRGPLPLSPDAANGALLNLLLALDSARVEPGHTLRYRLLERGDADELDYVVGAKETVEVPAGRYAAIVVRGDRPEKQRVTTAWYAPGLPPTPVRVLQREKGRDKFELRLVSVSKH